MKNCSSWADHVAFQESISLVSEQFGNRHAQRNREALYVVYRDISSLAFYVCDKSSMQASF